MLAARFLALFAAAFALVLIPAPGASGAQSYPAKPVRIVLSLSPGSTNDFLARILAQKLSDAYKQQVLVDNRPGGGGLIAFEFVAKAAPDGSTLALIGPGWMITPLLQVTQFSRPLDEFVAIAQVASAPNVLVVAPDVPAKNVQELIAYGKANPGKLNFATTGIGSIGYMEAEIFNRTVGIQAVHVPFKVMGDVYTSMQQTLVHYYIFALPGVLPTLRDGRLRAFAVTTAKRSAALPDVPTIAEAGVPGAQSDAWFGIVAPAGTPREVVAQLSSDIARILGQPETKEQFERVGADPTANTTPTAFSGLLKSEYARYQKLIKDIGLKPQ